jgi:signal transduction histidine kinase
VLRTRLALLVAGSVLAGLIGFAVVVDVLFTRFQRDQMDTVLSREAQRAATLVAESQVGASFLEDGDRASLLQFVDADGVVRLPVGGGPALPLAREPTRVTREDGSEWLVTSVPWTLPSGLEIGTVRVGQSFEGVAAVRAALLRAILLGGAALALATTSLALWLLGRSLSPLTTLVREAERIDPARPQLEARLVASGRPDEVGALARSLEAAVAAIRERQQAERDALAEVAHELAAPLSVVAGRLRGIEARDPSPEIRAARRAADELLYTSRDLLAVARGELERGVDMEVVDLAQLVRGVAAETPFVQVDAGPVLEVLGSPERLRQAVRNLLRNALAAGGEPSQVRVEVAGDADAVAVTVLDRGPGLPPGDAETLFERHRSRRAGGTGLGLSVARSIAEAHEGTLTAFPREGGGACFVLRLPSLASHLDDEVEPDAHTGASDA